MLDNEKNIKEFIKWCKANKVKSFKCKDVEFELSELGFIEQDLSTPNVTTNDLEKAQEITEDSKLEEIQQLEEEEDLLLWSAN